MSLTTLDDFNLRADLREVNGEWQFLKALTEDRMNAIRLLLAGQSSIDLTTFDSQVDRLLEEGYNLTSLVVDLRRPLTGDSKQWNCQVRPKIGARPAQRNAQNRNREPWQHK